MSNQGHGIDTILCLLKWEITKIRKLRLQLYHFVRLLYIYNRTFINTRVLGDVSSTLESSVTPKLKLLVSRFSDPLHYLSPLYCTSKSRN